MNKILLLQTKDMNKKEYKNFDKSNLSIGCDGRSNVSLYFC